MKIGIIIPTYNEEKRIGRTLESYLKYFKEKKRKKQIEDFEIVVVLNACKDNTFEIVKKYKCSELKILNFERGGKGFAITEGFKEALKNKKTNLIGFVDADMATSPEAFYDLVKNIKGFDGIIASRYIGGAYVEPKQNFARRVVSRVGNIIIRTLFLMPYRDTQCGAKVFKKEALEKIISKLGVTNWAFDIDLLYLLRKEKLRIREFPTVWKDVQSSTLNLKKVSVQVFLAIFQLRILNSPFKHNLKIIKPFINFIWKKVK